MEKEDLDYIIEGVSKNLGQCKLKKEEREFVHVANRYVDTKDLPLLGDMLRSIHIGINSISKVIVIGLIVIVFYMVSQSGLFANLTKMFK